MKYYVQFMLICLFAVIGEAISTFFKLPIPGSIIGLFLLLIALQLKWIRLRHIHAVAEFLIANMTILFFQNKRLFKEVVIKNSYVTTYIGADKVPRLSKYKFEYFKQSD